MGTLQKNKLLFVALFSVCLVIFGFSYNHYNFVLQEKDDIRQSLLTLTYTTSQGVKTWAKERISFAQSMANLSEVEEIVNRLVSHPNSEDKRKLSEILLPIIQAKKYQGYLLVNEEYNVIDSNYNGFINKNFYVDKTIPFFKKLSQGIAAFMPPTVELKKHIGKDFGSIILVGAPIRDDSSKIKSYLIFYFDSNTALSELFQYARMGNTGETYAFNSEGYLIIKSQFEGELRDKKLIREDENSVLNVRITDPGPHMANEPFLLQRIFPLTKMAQSALQGYTNVSLDGYRNYRGDLVIGAWAWDPDLEIGIASEIDLVQAYAFLWLNTRIYKIIGAFSIVLLLAIIALFFKNRRQMERINEELEIRIAERTQELSRKNELLEDLALIDALTEIPNRRQFDKIIKDEFNRASRTQTPVTLLMIDIDFFKQINDHYGHTYGDHCLKQISKVFKAALHRGSDFVARYGGEEFVFILPNTPKESGKLIGELIMHNIQKLEIPNEYSKASKFLTVSIGLATMIPSMNDDPKTLIDMSDKKLYEAKKLGRNQIAL